MKPKHLLSLLTFLSLGTVLCLSGLNIAPTQEVDGNELGFTAKKNISNLNTGETGSKYGAKQLLCASYGGAIGGYIDQTGDLYVCGWDKCGASGSTTFYGLLGLGLTSNYDVGVYTKVDNVLQKTDTNGNGSIDDDDEESIVPLTSKVVKVDSNGATTGFLTADGDFYLTGDNQYGQQGTGDKNTVHRFRKINPEGVEVTSFTIGTVSSGYIVDSGHVFMTGSNSRGQQANGEDGGGGTSKDVLSFTDRTPKDSGGNYVKVKQVCIPAYGGYNTSLVTENGDYYMAGCDYWSAFGDGHNGDYNHNQTSFVKIDTGEETVVKAYIGQVSYGYLTSNGIFYLAGCTQYGCQGNGVIGLSSVVTYTQRNPVISGVTQKISKVILTSQTSAFLTMNGDYYICGRGDQGAQGSGGTANVGYFTKRNFDASSNSIEVSDFFTCDVLTAAFITKSGDVYVSGYDSSGAQANGAGVTNNLKYTKIVLPTGVKASAIFTCWAKTLIGTTDGDIYGTGYDYYIGYSSYDSENRTCTYAVIQTLSLCVSYAGSGTVSLDGWTYAAETQPEASFSTTCDYQYCAYEYSTDSGVSWTSSRPADAGTYLIRGTLMGGTNYRNFTTEAATFSIGKATGVGYVSIDFATYGITYTPVIGNPLNYPTVDITYSSDGGTTWDSSAPTSVGSYKVKAVFSGSNNYTDCSSIDDYDIHYVTGGGTVSQDDVSYGTTISPITTNPYSYPTITLSYCSLIGDSSWSSTVPTANGTYIVRAVFSGLANYEDYVTIDTFSIGKTVGEGKVILDGWTYGEDGNTPTFSSFCGYASASYEYSIYPGNDWTDNKPSKAGIYYVRARLTGSSHYGDCTTDKVQFTIAPAVGKAAIKQDDFHYGETSSPTIVNPLNFPNVDISYSSDGGTTWATEQPLTIGDYQVKGVFAGLNNYSSFTAYDDFSILVATGKGSVSQDDISYGGTISPVVSNPLSYPNVVISYSKNDGISWGEDVPATCGTYIVKASFAGLSTYSSLAAYDTFTIGKLVGSVSVSIDSWKYGETSSEPSSKQSCGYVGVNYEYSSDGGSTWTSKKPEEVGDYLLRGNFFGSPNYSDLTSDSVSFSVTKAEGSGVVIIDNFKVGDTPSDPSVFTSDGYTIIHYEYSSDGGVTWVDEEPTEVGSYLVRAQMSGSSNYEDTVTAPTKFEVLSLSGSNAGLDGNSSSGTRNATWIYLLVAFGVALLIGIAGVIVYERDSDKRKQIQ